MGIPGPTPPTYASKSRSYRGHECMYMYNTLSHGDTLMCQIWYDCVREQKTVALLKTLKILTWCQRSTSYWNHECTQDINSCAKYDMPNVKASRKYGSDTKLLWSKTYRFDLEVKGKGWTGVMNACDTWWYSWWYTNVPNIVCQYQSKKKFGTGKESTQREYNKQ